MPDKPKILRRSVLDKEAMGVLYQEYRRNKSVFSIGWLAGRGRRGLMDDFCVEFLKELDNRIKDETCVFKCFGHFGLPEFKKVKIEPFGYRKSEDWRGLYSKFVEMDLGVVVNILDESDDFCRCKSCLKLVESGAMGVPLVVSRIEPFLDIVKEGENGFFASTPVEFAEKVLLVMRDELLAEKVSKAVRAMVMDKYNVDKNAKKFFDDMTKEMNKWKERIPFKSSIEQSIIVSQSHMLKSIEVFGATYMRKISADALVEIRVDGKMIKNGHIPHSEMGDNQWWKFQFNPISIRKGNILTVKIINKDHNPITFYRCAHKDIAKANIGVEPSRPIAMVLEIE
jgi:polyhydroxyalkanoate synthesis regulator phasin